MNAETIVADAPKSDSNVGLMKMRRISILLGVLGLTAALFLRLDMNEKSRLAPAPEGVAMAERVCLVADGSEPEIRLSSKDAAHLDNYIAFQHRIATCLQVNGLIQNTALVLLSIMLLVNGVCGMTRKKEEKGQQVAAPLPSEDAPSEGR